MLIFGFNTSCHSTAKTTFDSDFYVEKVLPIVKRDGIKLIEDNFILQQVGAKPHTSGQSMGAIEKLGFSVIAHEIHPIRLTLTRSTTSSGMRWKCI